MLRHLSRTGLLALLSATSLFALPSAAAHAATDSGELGTQLDPLRTANSAEIADARDAGVTVQQRRALVDVYVSGDVDRAADRLEALGMEVAATATKPLPVVEGWIPLDVLSKSESLGLTDAILPVTGGGTDVGAVTSQGVTVHRVPAAIAALGTSGAGIDVGVISDSIDQVGAGVDGSQATGDLPPDPKVQVLLDDTAPTASDEGRAMAEIIFDEAPGLDRLLFSSGTASGPVGKAASIDALVAAGANVIADDIFYLPEPFFQDGAVAQAVDRARAAGVPYYASAGNRARQSYEGVYRDAAGLHDFDPGPGVDTRNCFSGTVPNGSFIQVALHWDEPIGGVTTDIDLQITNPGGTVLAASQASSISNGLSREIATFSNGGAAVQPCVQIRRFAGARTPFLKWIEFDGYTPTPVPEFDTQSNAINPDAASAIGSMSVAAVSAADAGLNTPETFSSRGPHTRLFDAAGNRLATPEVRFNPDLAAADMVDTTVPGFAPFGGTSAATPSAAGIATLLRSANPNATVNEIYAQSSDVANAIECTSSVLVPDPDCGAGFLLADRAAAELDRTAAVVSPSFSPAKPTGKRGFYTGAVSAILTATDPESPVEGSNGCGTFPVTAQGTTSLTCTALSGGGPGTGTATVKRDTERPKKPKIKGFNGNGPLPPKKKIKCKSKDATSGIASCKIKGYSAKPGKHTLKAVATDKAGLKSKTRKLKYEV